MLVSYLAYIIAAVLIGYLLSIHWDFLEDLFFKICRVFGCCNSGSGSGSGSINQKTFKLVRSSDEAIGRGFHRSGWDRVLKHLRVISVEEKQDYLLDDFVEQTYCYFDSSTRPIVYTKPWIGVFHHVPNPPYFGNTNERLEIMVNLPEFKQSAKYLKHAICLSSHLAEYLEKLFAVHKINARIHVIKHPTFFEFQKWDYDLFAANKNKQLIQVGFYMRNLQLINQIPPTPGFSKTRLMNNSKWVKEFDLKCKKYFELNSTRKFYGDSKDKQMTLPSTFDKLLACNIVVVEYFDVSASNTLLDCINRNTPIIVNRNPAVIEYLGENYPLYYNNVEEIPGLLIQERIKSANTYLVNMDKTDLTTDYFINKMQRVIN